MSYLSIIHKEMTGLDGLDVNRSWIASRWMQGKTSQPITHTRVFGTTCIVIIPVDFYFYSPWNTFPKSGQKRLRLASNSPKGIVPSSWCSWCGRGILSSYLPFSTTAGSRHIFSTLFAPLRIIATDSIWGDRFILWVQHSAPHSRENG